MATKQSENRSEYIASLDFTVRDYECDLQGVVNNANYQHYLEHARHEFLVSQGISFSDLHDEGIDLIVTRVEIDYKFPLRSRDRFTVRSAIKKEGNIRFVFFQDIYRIPDEKLIVRAKITGVSAHNGKPSRPDKIFNSLNLK